MLLPLRAGGDHITVTVYLTHINKSDIISAWLISLEFLG